jgi:hypothetical protein
MQINKESRTTAKSFSETMDVNRHLLYVASSHMEQLLFESLFFSIIII